MDGKVDCSERLKAALQMRDMTQADLCRVTGIPTSAMSQYCRGTLIPRQKRTKVIADALSVSVAWLMGFDVPKEEDLKNVSVSVSSGLFCEPPIERADASCVAPAPLTGQETELLRVFKSLSVRGQTRLLTLAFELEKEEGKNGAV